ncbi:MAG: pyridoxamine 5'-phosphate oxidase family protein [Deltaproteobacteria bacterium]|nr:pyridoxamine 5'-phosphate oxidase family protein [Deltaproteobacteria bacterium]
MRKKEKEIFDESAIESVILDSLFCTLGMVDGNTPYVVPLCFGYKDKTIYLHGSLKGKKTNALKKNPNVCFEFDVNAEIIQADDACDWGVRFKSVIGFGKASFLDHFDEKREALNIIMSQYSDHSFHFPDDVLKKTAVIKIRIDSMTGKQSGF